MISAKKREELEAAGYSVSKSGKNVLKDGKTIGGVNDNGIWAGSKTVADILRGESKSEAKPKSSSKSVPKRSTSAKPTRSKSTKKEPPVAKSASVPEVKTRKLSKNKGGRGDGVIEWARRKLEPANAGASKKPTQKSTTPSRPKGTKPMVVKGSLTGAYAQTAKKFTREQWKKMSRSERKANGLPVSTAGGLTTKFKGE